MFFPLSSKSNVSFTLTVHLNSDTVFSLEMIDLHLDIIKYSIEK